VISPYIIAEVGTNHGGNLNTAIRYVKEISKTGVDAIKFQIANPYKVFSKDSFKKNYYQNINKIKKRLLSFNDHKLIYKKCNELGLDYLCSAFDLESLKFIHKNFKLKYFKIPSGEVRSLDILKFISQKRIPVIVSTGMTNDNELKKIIKILNKKNKEIIILHCVSSYPAKKEELNLLNIVELKKKFKLKTGYSDHYPGIDACVIASLLGARIIEKHVTFNRSLKGPDHKSSCTIVELKKMVKIIKKNESFLRKKKK